MKKESVDTMMANYREYCARCEYLENDIKVTERFIETMKEGLVEDLISITACMTGMPHGSGISDPTGRVGDMIASGRATYLVEDVINEVAGMKEELAEKMVTVVFVNSWIRALDNKERFVIEQKMLGGLSWRQLTFTFKRQFGDTYSQQGLRRIRDAAMQKIYRIAE